MTYFRRSPGTLAAALLACALLLAPSSAHAAKKTTKPTFKVPAAVPVGKDGIIDRLEASVNSSLILLSDVILFRKTLPLRSQLDPLFAGHPLATKSPGTISDADIVDFLISDRIILDQFPIKDAEVEQEINSIQATNRIDRKSLKAALKEQGFAFEEYFSLIRVSISKRNLIDRDIRTKVYISDEDVKNHFYNDLQKKTSAVFAYKIQIITVTPTNYKVRGAALGSAQDALKAIHGGEAFSEVAKRFSDDPSAATGGDLGMLNEEEISPQIRQAVKKLKVGQVSDVMGTENTRFFILKLVDIKSGEEDRLAKAKDEIRGKLMTAEYQHQIEVWLDHQRLSAYIRLAGDPSLPGSYGK